MAWSSSATLFKEWRVVAGLGGPILIAQIAQIANGVIDTLMAGRASAQDLAAVGLGSSLWVPLLLMGVGLLNALQPTISHLKGAGKLADIPAVAWQGIYIAIFCAFIGVFALHHLHLLLPFFKVDVHTATITHHYLVGLSIGIIAQYMMFALRGYTDALNYTHLFMIFSLIGTLLNIPLNYALIYGAWGFPKLGGAGCGWATSMAQIIACLVFMGYITINSNLKITSPLHHFFAPKKILLTKLLHLGLPIGITFFVEVSMFNAVALLLAPLGNPVIAAHQIVLNCVGITFMIPLSLGLALTLRVSYLLGSQNTHAAQQLARSGLFLGFFIALFNVLIILILATQIPVFFTQDTQIQTLASQLFLFAALFQLVDAIQVIAIGGLRGYQDTRAPMLIMILSFWIICLPLGYLFTYSSWLFPAMGASGFWLGLSAGLTVACALLSQRLWIISKDTQGRALTHFN